MYKKKQKKTNFQIKTTVSSYLFICFLRLLGCHLCSVRFVSLLLMHYLDVPSIPEMFVFPPLPFFFFFCLLYFCLLSLYHTTHPLAVDCTDAVNPIDESEQAFLSLEEKSPLGLLIPGTASFKIVLFLILFPLKILCLFVPSNGAFPFFSTLILEV